MQNDRKISISCGNNRNSKVWHTNTLLWSELIKRLEVPQRSAETLAEYLKLKKVDQDNLKDVGGFVGGTFNGSRRKAINITGRDVITLDLDDIPTGCTDSVLRRVDALGCAFCVYSTRKHQSAAPRLRVLFPSDRTMNADEYEPVARKMASLIGIECADPTTFDVARLMYWPSCCSDSEYIFLYGDKPFLSADGLLAQYADWRNQSEWPRVPGKVPDYSKLAKKQGDPEEKGGVVGTFCRTYDIHRAMAELIPGIYEPVDGTTDRYTFTKGSTTGGAVIYNDGKFLYSHHATDPCSGRLVNAFDLVRLHKFSEKDDEAVPGTPTNRLPSYVAMCEFALSLPEVRSKRAAEDFAEVKEAQEQPSDLSWTYDLTLSASGGYEKTLNNIMLIAQNAPELKGCARKDKFTGRILTVPDLPWESGVYWSDTDTTELRRYFDTRYKMRPSKQDIKDAIMAIAVKQGYHPVQEYLTSLTWDRIPRLDTVFIDYLGVADSPYARAVTRKSFTGAVARVMVPGCKFDYMVVLVGEQGRNKSSMLRILAGADWFSDSMATFDGKNAFESVVGKWLIEIPEMQAFDKTTMNQAKAFITKQSDFYRAAYAEFPEDRPRQCVFFGTTNERECLRDATGGRRFWPLDIDAIPRKKSPFEDLPKERDQLWAEAYVRWQEGERLYLPQDLECVAKAVQEEHRESSARELIVLDFITKEVPDDWNKWPLDKRRMFWSGNVIDSDKLRLVPRDRICALEVWCEAFGGTLKEYNNRNAIEINAILNAAPEWQRANSPIPVGGGYGKQRGFYRMATNCR